MARAPPQFAEVFPMHPTRTSHLVTHHKCTCHSSTRTSYLVPSTSHFAPRTCTLHLATAYPVQTSAKYPRSTLKRFLLFRHASQSALLSAGQRLKALLCASQSALKRKSKHTFSLCVYIQPLFLNSLYFLISIMQSRSTINPGIKTISAMVTELTVLLEQLLLTNMAHASTVTAAPVWAA
ncbi:hypothetical protein BDZ97DRAFT_860145 [Flammula alnicola]|nr:hypothetical protein BDZ97DRAFT_860145 [Flammula alnicola]